MLHERVREPRPALGERVEVRCARVLAPERAHGVGAELVGEEVLDPQLLDFTIATREVVVTQASMTDKPIAELGFERFGCSAVGLTRATIDLQIDERTTLRRGDVVRVIGEESKVRALANRLGYLEEELEDTDLVTFSAGIVAGILLGLVVVKLGALSIGLGSAGGLLAAGLTISYLRALRPFFGRVPSAARWIFMELGLTIFMAGVGLRAGSGIIETLADTGLNLFLAGVVVTSVPVAAGYLFGRKVLSLNPVYLLGAITGSMTSGASLSIVTGEARSSLPALGYTGAYAFANVLLTVAGSLILLL